MSATVFCILHDIQSHVNDIVYNSMINNFSNNIKLLRLKNNLLQTEIAAQLNITVRQYQRYEGNTSKPRFDDLIFLADYFGVSIDYLVGRTDNPKVNK